MADGFWDVFHLLDESLPVSWPLVHLSSGTLGLWPPVHRYSCPSVRLTTGTVAYRYACPPETGGHLERLPPGTGLMWTVPHLVQGASWIRRSPGTRSTWDESHVGRYSSWPVASWHASRSGLSGGTLATLSTLLAVLGGWTESLFSLERLFSYVSFY